MFFSTFTNYFFYQMFRRLNSPSYGISPLLDECALKFSIRKFSNSTQACLILYFYTGHNHRKYPLHQKCLFFSFPPVFHITGNVYQKCLSRNHIINDYSCHIHHANMLRIIAKFNIICKFNFVNFNILIFIFKICIFKFKKIAPISSFFITW